MSSEEPLPVARCLLLMMKTTKFENKSLKSHTNSAYIHIPFCRRRCYYCDFPISVLGNKTDINNSPMIDDYVQVLCQEIRVTPPQDSSLDTVFFGGGTPSLLPVKALVQILNTLEQHFGINPDAEISMEMDPGTFTATQLQGYLSAGVNRISLGVQSFDDQLLAECGRSHNRTDIFAALELMAKFSVPNLSLDLISGLPNQSISQWQNSLETALKIAPNHLSCYDLVLEPVTAFGKQYREGKHPLPTDEITAKMYCTASEMLRAGGYKHYEISNYAQPGYQCRHNLVYWQNRPYYGFGMGAASYVNEIRFTRPRTREKYYTWVEQLKESGGVINAPVTTISDRLLETLMLGLRLAEGVQLSLIREKFGQQALESIWQGLKPYFPQEWVEGFDFEGKPVTLKEDQDLFSLDRIRLTDPDGFLFSNTILAALFEQVNTNP